MKFYETENEWAVYKGVWVESDSEDATYYDLDNYCNEDMELYEMGLMLCDSGCLEEDEFYFDYTNWKDQDKNWYLVVTIPDGSWSVYVDGECIGIVDVGSRGNEVENILLGIYDLIEKRFGDQ